MSDLNHRHEFDPNRHGQCKVIIGGRKHSRICHENENAEIHRKPEEPPMVDPLQPAATILIKLGSLAVHVEEFLSTDGHEFDHAAIQTLLDDSELRDWLKQMDEMAFLPKKRTE